MPPLSPIHRGSFAIARHTGKNHDTILWTGARQSPGPQPDAATLHPYWGIRFPNLAINACVQGAPPSDHPHLSPCRNLSSCSYPLHGIVLSLASRPARMSRTLARSPSRRCSPSSPNSDPREGVSRRLAEAVRESTLGGAPSRRLPLLTTSLARAVFRVPRCGKCPCHIFIQGGLTNGGLLGEEMNPLTGVSR